MPKMIEQACLRFDVVANGDEGEVCAERLAGGGINGTGTGCAITRPQDVDADHEVALEIETSIGAEQVCPPGAHVRRARQRMTDEDGVVALGVQCAVNRVVERHRLELASGFQKKGLVFTKGEDGLISWSDCLTHLRVPAPTGSSASRDLPDGTLFSSACSRSAMMSFTSSMPTERRIRSGVTPVDACSSSLSC